MTDPWKPSVRIWPFRDAPEEFRCLCPEPDGTEELVIYVPPELCALFAEDDWIMVMPRALWFLAHPPKRKGLVQSAGDEWGRYLLCVLPDGSRVAITEGGLQDSPS